MATDDEDRIPGDSPRARYRRDSMFHALVDQLRTYIARAMYTPSELREAVILAAILEEERRSPADFVPTTCQRCGKIGGRVVSYRLRGLRFAQWECPHCPIGPMPEGATPENE